MVTDAPVVVGVDSTPGSLRPVRWAAIDAARRHTRLDIIAAYDWLLAARSMASMYGDHPDADLVQAQKLAEQAATRAVQLADEVVPGLAIRWKPIDANPVKELVERSREAAVVTIGSRGLRATGSLLLGSIGGAVAARAHSPVVVTRSIPGSDAEGAEVVVGIDGSEDSEYILDFAVGHARRHRLPIRVLLCWWPSPFAPIHDRSVASSAEEAERWLKEAIAGRRATDPQLRWHQSVLDEHPVNALVTASQSQSLLVVGNHHRTVVGGTIFGSVTQGVLHHATCPVAIVPAVSPDRHVRDRLSLDALVIDRSLGGRSRTTDERTMR